MNADSRRKGFVGSALRLICDQPAAWLGLIVGAQCTSVRGRVLLHPLLGLCRLRPLASHLFGGNIEAVPDVDQSNSENQRGQGALVVVTGSFVPDLVGYRIHAIA